MNDETRKLFDTPWTVYGEPDDYSFVIQNASEDEIATVFMTDEAKRLTHLPELYDALMDEAIEKCNECLHENLRMGRIPFTGKYDFVEAGCPFKDEECHTASHLNLLKKVRDGE